LRTARAFGRPPARGLRRECSLDSERLQALDHLGADFAIDPHAAERDAAIATVIDEAALQSTFPALLGMAATYAFTAIVALLPAADGLARNSVFMPQLLD
jgi:hypothetical protein